MNANRVELIKEKYQSIMDYALMFGGKPYAVRDFLDQVFTKFNYPLDYLSHHDYDETSEMYEEDDDEDEELEDSEDLEVNEWGIY